MDCSSSSSSGDDEEAVVAAARRQVARRSEALLAGLPDKPEVGEIQTCTGCGLEADSTMAAWFGEDVHRVPGALLCEECHDKLDDSEDEHLTKTAGTLSAIEAMCHAASGENVAGCTPARAPDPAAAARFTQQERAGGEPTESHPAEGRHP